MSWPMSVSITNATVKGVGGEITDAVITGDITPVPPDPPPDVPPVDLPPIPPDPPIDVPPPPSDKWQWAFVTDPPLGWVLVPPGGGGKPRPLPPGKR